MPIIAAARRMERREEFKYWCLTPRESMKENLLHKIYQRPLMVRIIFLFAIDCDKT